VLTLSDGLTDTDSPTQQALCEQMRANRDYPYAQPFVFDTTISDLVCREYDAMVNDQFSQESFIRASREMTQHLYSIIRGNHNVKVGDLLLGLFREGNDDPWLAILKMQPAGDTYIRERRTSRTPGDVAFTLRVSSGALLGGVLQKCAFIAPRSLRKDNRDLIVLDQQALQRGHLEPAARFFIDRFLGCKIQISEREMTRHFKGVLTKIARERAHEWGAAATAVIETMATLQEGTRIDVPETLDRLVPEQDRPLVRAALQEKRVTAPVFTVTPPLSRAQQQPDYVWFEGGNGLLLRPRPWKRAVSRRASSSSRPAPS